MLPDNRQVSFLGSKKWCLTTNCHPTLLMSWTANCQALYLGSQKISQNCGMTIIVNRDDGQFIVRYMFWDLRNNPRNVAVSKDD